jgi:hypothetical protein
MLKRHAVTPAVLGAAALCVFTTSGALAQMSPNRQSQAPASIRAPTPQPQPNRAPASIAQPQRVQPAQQAPAQTRAQPAPQPPAQAKAQPAQQHAPAQHATQPSRPAATSTTLGQGGHPVQTTTPQQASPVKSEPAKVDPKKMDLTVHPKEPDKNAIRTLEPLKDAPQQHQRFEGGGVHVPDGQGGSQTVIVGKDNKTGLGIEATRREVPGAPADNKLQFNYTSDPKAPPPQKDPVRPEGEVPPGR